MATETKAAEKTADVSKDSRFVFGPAPIQTPEDAVQAYLREEISEEELRGALGKFGVVKGTLLAANSKMLERLDHSFKRDLPADLLVDSTTELAPLEERLKAVEERDKEAAEATKAAEKESSTTA